METGKLKEGDKIIVTLLNDDKKTSEEVPVSVVRVGNGGGIVVVKKANGTTKVIPGHSVVRFERDKVVTPEPKNEALEVGNQIHEAVLDGKEPTNETAKQIVKTLIKAKPVSQRKKRIKAIAAHVPVQGVTVDKKVTIPDETPAVTLESVMSQADALAADATEKLAIMKGKAPKPEPKPETLKRHRATRIEISKRNEDILKYVAEGKLLNREIANMFNIDQSEVSKLRSKYKKEQQNGNG